MSSLWGNDYFTRKRASRQAQMWEYLDGMARVILDTNNVLGATDALPTEIAGPTPQEFVDLLVASRRYPDGFLLICDGVRWDDAPKTLPSGIQVRFSRHGVTADEVIARVVSQSSISRHLLVVTTDRALQKQVKRLKTSTMDSEGIPRRTGIRLAKDGPDATTAGGRPRIGPKRSPPSGSGSRSGDGPAQKGIFHPQFGLKYLQKFLKSPNPAMTKLMNLPLIPHTTPHMAPSPSIPKPLKMPNASPKDTPPMTRKGLLFTSHRFLWLLPHAIAAGTGANETSQEIQTIDGVPTVASDDPMYLACIEEAKSDAQRSLEGARARWMAGDPRDQAAALWCCTPAESGATVWLQPATGGRSAWNVSR